MQRWACGVSYLGGHYHGWQKQPYLKSTVEQVLTEAVSEIADAPVELTCAGRTDKGVHALGQVIHFDAPKARTALNWLQGCNKKLPTDVKLQWAVPVDDAFHARYSARMRCYRYLIYNHAVSHPLLDGRAWWVKKSLEQYGGAMQEAASYWIGEHDFSSFRDADCQAAHPVRTLHRCTVQRRERFYLFDIEGNAFLHHMVRNMLGVLIEIGMGKKPVTWAQTVLEARSRSAAGVTAPPEGLYLREVNYAEPWQTRLPLEQTSITLPL